MPSLSHVASAEDILAAQALVGQVHISMCCGATSWTVRATRAPESADADLAGTLSCGASPRASIALARARAHAVLDGRGYALPEDVKAVAPDVLRHRCADLRSRGRRPIGRSRRRAHSRCG